MAMKQEEHILIESIAQASRQVTFSKLEVVVRQGQALHNLYYITQGLVRGYYLDEDGKEVTKCFSAEQNFFGTEGFLYQRDASFSIECLEEVRCYKIPYEEVREWMAQDPTNAAVVNKMIIEQLRMMEERAKSLLLSDAKERYEQFLIDYKPIVERLTQKAIASYLGINEASLCRLKRKLT